MRTIFILAITFIISISGIHAPAQTVEEIAAKINRPMPVTGLMNVRAQLERLANTPYAGWLTLYYLAYADVELSFRVENATQKEQYIREAQSCLDNIKDGDRSEVETLRAYSYFALMAIDPGTNGPKYAADIIPCFEKALKYNPANPRAILLHAVFQNKMSEMMGSQYKEFDADIIRSKELFEKQDTTPAKPYWGYELLKKD
jgi:hypothetical protein